MAEITAKLVNDLRSKTGQGMMECKKMLTDCGGDIEKAIEGFRKKGVKASLSERADKLSTKVWTDPVLGIRRSGPDAQASPRS